MFSFKINGALLVCRSGLNLWLEYSSRCNLPDSWIHILLAGNNDGNNGLEDNSCTTDISSRDKQNIHAIVRYLICEKLN